MSVSKISKGLLLGLALLLATSVFAANKGTLQVSDSVTVNGKQLAAGDYTVKWEGAGPNVELNILKGKNVVATVPARMVDLERSPDRDSAVTAINSDGRKSLNEIRFSGEKICLRDWRRVCQIKRRQQQRYQRPVVRNLIGIEGDTRGRSPFFCFCAGQKRGLSSRPLLTLKTDDCFSTSASSDPPGPPRPEFRLPGCGLS